jgi:hypothetical protein
MEWGIQKDIATSRRQQTYEMKAPGVSGSGRQAPPWIRLRPMQNARLPSLDDKDASSVSIHRCYQAKITDEMRAGQEAKRRKPIKQRLKE